MSNKRGIFLILILSGLSACTDKREPERKIPVTTQRAPRGILQSVGDIRITKGSTTANINVYQMTQKNGAIYVTGTADSNVNLGFAKWDISSDPEAPNPLFNVGDNIEEFEPIKGWRPDFLGSGALGILGNYAIMSGTAGVSFVNLAQSANPIETKRYPMPNPDSPTVPQDPNYVYRAIVPHPSRPSIYGMREQDYMLVSDVTSNGLTTYKNNPIWYGGAPGTTVCCVQGGTVFGHQMYVAMRGMLRAYDLGTGLFAPTFQDNNTYQAVNVVSTRDLLYVQHKPSFGTPSGNSRAGGIYVFDQSFNSVAFLPIEPIQFVISDDNSHVYANMDGTSVRIYRIDWTNR